MVEGHITLRKATPEDMDFLARLYFDTRRQEVAAWGWPLAQQEMFLRMQFNAKCRSYRAEFPDAVDRIVCVDGAAAGRMMVDQKSTEMHLIDIALLEEHRNHGVGTHLLCELFEQCRTRGDTLRLQALKGNPATRLYRRLGFLEAGADAMYVQMEWNP